MAGSREDYDMGVTRFQQGSQAPGMQAPVTTTLHPRQINVPAIPGMNMPNLPGFPAR